MITPELISYIKSQLSAGVARDSISSALSNQGWQAQDIQEAFNSISAPITAQSVIATKKGWTIGKIFLLIFTVGVIGAVIAGALGVYYVYSNLSHLPEKICSNSSSATDRANCQQMVKNFFGFLIKKSENSQNIQNNSGNLPANNQASADGCSNGYTDKSGNPGIGDITDLVGINDPLICHYSQPSDLTGLSKIIMDISGTKDNSNNASKIVYEINTQKTIITGQDGKSYTIEPANSSGSVALGGIASLYMNVLRMEIPMLQMCIKSTNWNTIGNWFSCDKITFMGVTMSSNDPNNKNDSAPSAIKVYEADTNDGKVLFVETRSIKEGNFSANSIEVLRNGRLVKSSKSIDIYNYTGTNLLSDKTVDEIINMNPRASYSDIKFSYEK
jgi:hypothetical protein